MNYGGDAADQIVRYSLDGLDHGLRLSGAAAKNLAVFFAAVLKDQKKTMGRTRMIRMLKENRPLKFFTVPSERLKEFAKEGKKRGLLYVVIRDKKHPEQCEVMVFADDAAKVNRVLDRMNLDFVTSGEATPEVEISVEQKETEPEKHTQSIETSDGAVEFEIGDFDQEFGFLDGETENFTKAMEEENVGEKNPSESSSHNKDILNRPEKDESRPSVRKELEEIKKEKQMIKEQEHLKEPILGTNTILENRAKNKGKGGR